MRISDLRNNDVLNDAGKENENEIACDVAIVGGGSAGYVAAIRCARNGLKTVLIEKDRLGGTCLNRGCIPTKTLVAVASFLSKIKRADEFGINISHYELSLERIRAKKEQIVSSLVQGIKFLMKKNKIRVIEGKAIVGEEGVLYIKSSPKKVRYKKLILATGSSIQSLTIPGADLPDVLNS